MSHHTPFPDLPQFQQIDLTTVVAQLDTLLQQNLETIDQLTQLDPPSWSTFITPLSDLDNSLQQFWSPISHLHSVCNTPELRPIYAQCIEHITAYSSEVSQNQKLYRQYQALTTQPEYNTYSAAQKQVIKHAIRDFKLAGVHLADTEKTQLKALQQALAEQATRFSQNVLDATEAWHYITQDEADLAGLPSDLRQRCWVTDEHHWKLGLDSPAYIAVMTYAEQRQLRETFYTAYQTRASDQGPHDKRWDNQTHMETILQKRHAKAQQLGFTNYVGYSLADKMADDFAQVEQFLLELAEKARPKAIQELDDLTAIAEADGVGTLSPWDVAYYSEKLKQTRFHISDQQLRPYFPALHVLQGLFAVTEQLYGISMRQNPEVEAWHADVMFYEVLDAQQKPIAGFYIDLYARTGKRGGAWMDELRTRYRNNTGALQHTIAYLVCNFTPPADTQPALLTHDEVITLFHEFGHTLHHLLSQVECYDVSGINGVPWDGVELPSQFMENFAWQKTVLNRLSCHIETAEPLPDNLFNALSQSRTFNSGLHILRQVEFALFDLYIHRGNTQSSADIQTCLDQVRQRISLLQPPAYNRFQNGFAHIFSGGYAAGYFSYLWAEVLSADAFGAFEENGILDPETCQSFQDIVLAPGGSVDLLQAFTRFRGRPPKIDALLRHLGIE